MKKLLLILLCLPMIGFGQDDKIIFSSGDTIYGKVIEVGVNDITYQHKDESTNNVSKKRELAKIIYSSGRTEIFKGLRTLETKYSKYELITCHTARRSFATNGFESKVPTRVLMRITGHKKETTFLNYVQRKREVELSQILEIYPTQLRKVG